MIGGEGGIWKGSEQIQPIIEKIGRVDFGKEMKGKKGKNLQGESILKTQIRTGRETKFLEEERGKHL